MWSATSAAERGAVKNRRIASQIGAGRGGDAPARTHARSQIDAGNTNPGQAHRITRRLPWPVGRDHDPQLTQARDMPTGGACGAADTPRDLGNRARLRETSQDRLADRAGHAPDGSTRTCRSLRGDGQIIIRGPVVGAKHQAHAVTLDQLPRQFVHHAGLDLLGSVALAYPRLGATFDLVHRRAVRKHAG